MNEQTVIDRLYGPSNVPSNATALSHGTVPVAKPAAAPTASSESSVIEKLYGTPEATVPVVPTGNDEQQQGDEQQEPTVTLTDEARRNLAPVMRDIEAVSTQRLGMTTEEAEANAVDAAAAFDAFGIDSSTASALTEYAVGIVTRDISDAQRMQWRRDSRDVIAQEVGPDNVDLAIKLAQALVAKRPSIRAWLSSTGAGDHPQFVRAVVNAAWRSR